MDRLDKILKERDRQRRESTAVVGKHGRIVIPAEIRKQLDINEGDRLMLAVEDGRLILMTRGHIQAAFEAARARIPPGVSVVDQLIEERREEARKEEEEFRRSLDTPRNVPEGP